MGDQPHFAIPTAPLSRRRLALRPLPSTASTSSAPVVAEPEPQPPLSSSEPKPTKAVWNSTEVNTFYEALKKHGKDFEAVVKTLVKRNISRDKDQVRNFYFNALKTFKAASLFDDELFPEISKDVKEMFIVINAYEWKRKTNNAPFDATSFKKLVLEGVVTLKMKGRRQPLVIRTPSCPCLLKYFTDRVGGLPSSVVLQLLPRTYGDRDFVVRCEQNPFLRVTMSMNDRIGRIFQLLKVKWRYPIEREGEIMPEDREYRLFVDSHVALSRLRIAKKNPRTDSFISMKRLMKGQQSDRGSTVEVPPLPPRKDEAGPSHRTISVSSCSEAEDDDFSDILIAADQIADGMTEDNCGSHALVELYYLCGRPEVIKLNYTISDPSMKDVIQPWQIFLDLLKRDYGKKLAVGMMDREKLKHRTKEKSESERVPALNDENSNSNSGDAPTPHPVEGNTPKVNRKRVAMHNTPPMLPASVAADAAAAAAKQFDAGLNKLQSRSKVRKVVKTTTENNKATLKQPPNCPIIEAEAHNFMKQYKDMKSRGKRMPISSASSISTTNNVVQAAANKNPFAVSELSDSSPNPQQEPAPQPTPQPGPSKEVVKDGPLPMSALFDMSEVSGNSIHHWFPNFGNEANDFSALSTNSNTFGHQLNSANGKTLPDDVRHSYEMMLQQNSVDYCRNFEQLVQSTQETPTKNRL